MGLMAQQSLLLVNRIFLIMLHKSMDALWIAGQQQHPFHGLPGLTCTFQTMTYIYSCMIFFQQLNVGCCMQKFECWWLEDRMLNSWIPLLSVAQHGPQMSSYYFYSSPQFLHLYSSTAISPISSKIYRHLVPHPT